MNPELEQLVEYALTDGYITDKERQVLVNKARNLGYDIDELEVILDAKLSQLSMERQAASSLRKCPSCGEVLTGYSMVCEACNYVVDTPVSKEQTNLIPITDTINRLKRKVNSYTLGEKTRSEYIANVVCYIIFTGGIYLIYKAIKWEPLFTEEDISYKESITDISNLISGARRSYGENPEIEKILADFEKEAAALIRKRRLNALRRGLISIAVIAAIIVGPIVIWPMLPEGEPSPEDLVEHYIKKGNVGKAKLWVSKVDGFFTKDRLNEQVLQMEIDSLTDEAKNYDAALRAAKSIEDTFKREDAIDAIVAKQVKGLIVKRDFKKARERAALASSRSKYRLENDINYEETISK